MLKIKLFAVLAFLALAAGAFLFSNNKTGAQEAAANKSNQKRAAVLEKIASYKQWQQLKKPDKKTDEPELILNSTAMG